VIILGFAGKKKKHILIIVENLPVPFDKRVWKEALALSKNDYYVSVICPKGIGYNDSYEIRDNIHIYRHPIPKEEESSIGYIKEYLIALFWELFLSIKIYLENQFHVIQGCNPPDNIFLIAIFYKLFGVKYIFDHHDLTPEQYIAKFNRKDLFYKILVVFEKVTFKFADISLSTNNSYKKIAINRGGMKPNKVYVVRNGPELNKFRKTKEEKSLKFGNRFLIGYVGTMGKQEGIDFLLDVMDYIINEKSKQDIHLTCIGGGPALNYLRKLTKEKNLSQYVNFPGRVSDKYLLKVLSTSDICVNPDAPNELNDKSTMIKIMEYMALKKPIVQFDFKEGKYSAQKASLYVKKGDKQDFAEKILYLLDNPELRKQMGEYGYQRVKNKLDWKYSIPNLLKAYETVLS